MSPSSPDRTASGRYIAITPEIERTAREIKRVFLEIRRSYCPDAGGVSKKQDHHFIKAALLCLKMKEDPQAFVMRQVEEMAEAGVWYPQCLYSNKMALASRLKMRSKSASTISLYISQLQLLKARLTIYPPEFALRDPSEPFTPLFRCCAAMHYNFPDVVDAYREAAKLELAAFPIAREALGPLVDRL